MFIGEAPGREEDKQGIPFCGRSGQLLRKMIAAVGLTPEDWYIANIVKDRPPDNRVPEQAEIDSCIRFLRKQIEIIGPELLVLLGRTAVKGLLPQFKDTPIDALRDQTKDAVPIEFEGVRVLVTYHPSALLRDPSKKPKSAADFRYIEAVVGERKEAMELPL
jgi:uracil-DNA glycosylase family 4